MRCWVIGGTSGIGLSVVGRLSHDHHVRATGQAVDVRSLEILREDISQFGKYDAIVFSAGVNRLLHAGHVDIDTFRLIYETNVLGFLNVMRALLETHERGRVVAVSSDAAVRPMRTSSLYCGSKAALDQTVRCLARELAPAWQVNAVAPGMVSGTEMTRYVDRTVPTLRGWSPEEALRYEQSQIPMKRRAMRDEIAQVIVDTLCGPNYLTGSIITVNGGR